MTSELDQFVKENSTYVSWEDDNGKTWILLSAKQTVSSFGGKTMEYVLKDEEGYERKFTSGSLALAREMAKLNEGEKARLTRSGEGPKTHYEVIRVQ